MKRRALFASACVAFALNLPSASIAQSSWGSWIMHQSSNGVSVYYRTRVGDGEMRVQWRCENETSSSKGCEIGRKTYSCYNGSYYQGDTYSLEERVTLYGGRDFEFGSDFACRDMGSNRVEVSAARVTINDE